MHDISIIIPAYNEERNLPAIIKHLREQSSKNFEIIVVDNNSTDGTYSTAKKLADKAYKCKAQGISYARNYGAEKANSEIIAFLDADSIPARSWIQSINDAFNDKGLSVVSGVDLYENKSAAKRLVLNTFSYMIFYYCTLLTWFGKPMLIANNMAIKRDVFEKAGGFDHFVVEDYYLTVKLRKLGCRTKMDGRMKVECSSRRIDKRGLLNTWKVWLVSLFKKIPSGDYALHDK